MSRREIQSQPIAPPATIVCLDCKEEVAYDLTHCPNCGRTLKVAKQRVMLALLMAQIPPLPIKSEVGVRRLLVALFGPDGFEHRFKGKPLPSFVAVAALLNGLYARDAEIVKRRYGLDDGEVWTFILDLGCFTMFLIRRLGS